MLPNYELIERIVQKYYRLSDKDKSAYLNDMRCELGGTDSRALTEALDNEEKYRQENRRS